MRYNANARILATASRDKTVKLWLPERGILLNTFRGHSKKVESIDISSDGKLLASASGDETVRIWNIGDGREKRSLAAHRLGAISVAFSPDGKLLASGGSDGTIKLWNPQTGELLKTISENQPDVFSLAFSPDGKLLASGSRRTVNIRSVEAGQIINQSTNLAPKVSVLAFSPDGKRIAAGGNLQIDILDTESGKKIGESLSNFKDAVSSVEFTRDGNSLMTGSMEKTVKFWNLSNGKIIRSFWENKNPVSAALLSPDGNNVFVGDIEGQVYIVNAQTGETSQTISEQSFSLGKVILSADDRLLAAAGAGKTIQLWDLEKGELALELAGHQKPISSIAFTRDGKLLASGSWDTTVKIWNSETGALIKSIPAHTSTVESVAFSPDGKQLVSSGSDNKIRIWEVSGGKKLLDIESESKLPFHTVIYSPDGTKIVGGHFYEFAAYDALNGKLLFTNHKNNSPISKEYNVNGRNVIYKPRGVRGDNALFTVISGNAAAFSPDGKILAARESKTLSLFDAESGKPLRNLTGDFWRIKNFAFTADSRYLIGADEEDGKIRVWNTATGEESTAVNKDTISGITSLGLDSGGSFLTSANREGEIKIWDLAAREDVVNLFAKGQDDWTIVSTNGYFTASPKAEGKLAFQIQSETINAGQLKVWLRNKDFLSRILTGKKALTNPSIPLYPEVIVRPITDGTKNKLEIELINRGGGIGRVQIFSGGKELISDARPDGFDPQAKSAKFIIDLPQTDKRLSADATKISISVFNKDENLTNRIEEVKF